MIPPTQKQIAYLKGRIANKRKSGNIHANASFTILYAFKRLWMKTIEVVELPKELQVYRSTGVAVVKFSKNKELAKKFVDFLISESGRKIYKEYGWYHSTP